MKSPNPTFRVVSTPILPVTDIGETMSFYSLLGFEVEAFDNDYGWVRHNGQEILHLRLARDVEAASKRSAVYYMSTMRTNATEHGQGSPPPSATLKTGRGA